MSETKETSKKRSIEWIEKGKRLQQLRILARIERDQAAILAGVARSTYKLLELGVNNLTIERATWFINGLQEIGITVTLKWLMEGVGAEPQKRQNLSTENITVSDINSDTILDQQLIEKELDYFCRNHTNSIYLHVADDSMAPIYKKGNIVAGIQCNKNNFSKLIGLDCIVKLKNGAVLLRNLNYGRKAKVFTLLSLNPHASIKIVQDVELQSAAPVIWHRRQNT